MDIEPRDIVERGLQRTFRDAPLQRLKKQVEIEDIKTVRDRAEAEVIRAALDVTRNHLGWPNKCHAAALLGISRMTLYKKMSRLKIE
jgi:transcriptional regulator of acetoin/glycerol metabolism